MFFDFLSNNSKRSSVFNKFASDGLSVAASEGITALMTLGSVAHPWIAIISAGAKGVVEALFEKSSAIESKIDRLLRAPLLTGIDLLRQGYQLDNDNEIENEGREDLLNEAHTQLSTAYNMADDSSEDKVFIFALDCLTLASNEKFKKISRIQLQQLNKKIKALEISFKKFKKEVTPIILQAKRTEVYLDKDNPYTDKPIGYAEQRLFWKSFIKEGQALKETIEQNDLKIKILQDLQILADILSNSKL